MKTSEVLEKALAVVTTNWGIGDRDDGKGHYCALGALDVALNVPTYRKAEYLTYKSDGITTAMLGSCQDVLIATCPDRTPTYCGMLANEINFPENWKLVFIAAYNNSSKREDVIAWFRKAVERQKTIELLAEIVPEALAPEEPEAQSELVNS